MAKISGEGCGCLVIAVAVAAIAASTSGKVDWESVLGIAVVGTLILIMVGLVMWTVRGDDAARSSTPRDNSPLRFGGIHAPPPSMLSEAPTFRTKVAGVSFRRNAVMRCVPGASLTLVREPRNEHDPNAVMVLNHHGEQIGYLNRSRAGEISGMMDHGVRFAARVNEITGADWDNPGVNIEVWPANRPAPPPEQPRPIIVPDPPRPEIDPDLFRVQLVRNSRQWDACKACGIGTVVTLDPYPAREGKPPRIRVLNEAGERVGDLPLVHSRVAAEVLAAGGRYETRVVGISQATETKLVLEVECRRVREPR